MGILLNLLRLIHSTIFVSLNCHEDAFYTTRNILNVNSIIAIFHYFRIAVLYYVVAVFKRNPAGGRNQRLAAGSGVPSVIVSTTPRGVQI